MSIEASASLRSSSEPAVVDRAGDADAACGEQRCAHNSVEEAAESREIRAKPLRRRGAPYSLTIGDHFALMITSALLMVCVTALHDPLPSVTAPADVRVLLLLRRPLRHRRLELPYDAAATHSSSSAPLVCDGPRACCTVRNGVAG